MDSSQLYEKPVALVQAHKSWKRPQKRLRAPALPGTWHLVWEGLGRFEEFGFCG